MDMPPKTPGKSRKSIEYFLGGGIVASVLRKDIEANSCYLKWINSDRKCDMERVNKMVRME